MSLRTTSAPQGLVTYNATFPRDTITKREEETNQQIAADNAYIVAPRSTKPEDFNILPGEILLTCLQDATSADAQRSVVSSLNGLSVPRSQLSKMYRGATWQERAVAYLLDHYAIVGLANSMVKYADAVNGNAVIPPTVMLQGIADAYNNSDDEIMFGDNLFAGFKLSDPQMSEGRSATKVTPVFCKLTPELVFPTEATLRFHWGLGTMDEMTQVYRKLAFKGNNARDMAVPVVEAAPLESLKNTGNQAQVHVSDYVTALEIYTKTVIMHTLDMVRANNDLIALPSAEVAGLKAASSQANENAMKLTAAHIRELRKPWLPDTVVSKGLLSMALGVDPDHTLHSEPMLQYYEMNAHTRLNEAFVTHMRRLMKTHLGTAEADAAPGQNFMFHISRY